MGQPLRLLTNPGFGKRIPERGHPARLYPKPAKAGALGIKWDVRDPLRDSLTIVLGTVLLFGTSAIFGMYNPSWAFVDLFPPLGLALSIVATIFLAVIFAMLAHHYDLHAVVSDALVVFFALFIADLFAIGSTFGMAFIVLLVQQVVMAFVVVGTTFWAVHRIRE